MFMYVYMYLYMYTYVHVYICTYITYVYVCMWHRFEDIYEASGTADGPTID